MAIFCGAVDMQRQFGYELHVEVGQNVEAVVVVLLMICHLVAVEVGSVEIEWSGEKFPSACDGSRVGTVRKGTALVHIEYTFVGLRFM